MSWLGVDAPNIASGWGAAPQLHAPEIGSLVAGILRNRLGQQELQQQQLSEAIKQMQEQRHSQAYTEALRNAGLTQGQDISGLSETDATRLATLIQAQTPDAATDALKKAQAAYYLGQGRQPRGGVNQEREARIAANEQFKQQQAQAGILGKQASDIEEQQSGFGLPADVPGGFGYMKNEDGTLRYATTPEEQAKPDLVSPTDILKGGKQPDWSSGAIDRETGQPTMPTFTPDVYKQRQEASALRQKILAQKGDIEKKILTPPVTQAGGGGGGGASQDAQAVAWAKAHPDDPRAAKILALQGNGG